MALRAAFRRVLFACLAAIVAVSAYDMRVGRRGGEALTTTTSSASPLLRMRERLHAEADADADVAVSADTQTTADNALGVGALTLTLDASVTGGAPAQLNIACTSSTCNAFLGLKEVVYALKQRPHAVAGVAYWVTANTATQVLTVSRNANAPAVTGAVAAFTESMTLINADRATCANVGGSVCKGLLYWRDAPHAKPDMVLYVVSTAAGTFNLWWTNGAPADPDSPRLDMAIIPARGVSVGGIHPKGHFNAADTYPLIDAINAAARADGAVTRKVSSLTATPALPVYGTSLNLNPQTVWKYGVTFYMDKLGFVPEWWVAADTLMGQITTVADGAGTDAAKALALAQWLAGRAGNGWEAFHAYAVEPLPWLVDLPLFTANNHPLLTWTIARDRAIAMSPLVTTIAARVAHVTVPGVWSAMANVGHQQAVETACTQARVTLNDAGVAFYEGAMAVLPIDRSQDVSQAIRDRYTRARTFLHGVINPDSGQASLPLIAAHQTLLRAAILKLKARWAQADWTQAWP